MLRNHSKLMHISYEIAHETNIENFKNLTNYKKRKCITFLCARDVHLDGEDGEVERW